MIGVIGIVISLLLLIWLAYKGWSVILVAPILALIAGLFAVADGNSWHPLAIYTENFMVSLAGYIRSNFPIFMLGAIFGKVMDASGCANSIAEFISEKLGADKAIWAVVLACAVITYGGVSLFVAAFAIYPIGADLFRKADIPKRLLPPAIALGAFTFTMTAIPGTPQIQNAIPMQYFGTDAFAAPILGIIAALIMFLGGTFWILSRAKKAKANGEGYGNHPNEKLVIPDPNNLPNFAIAIIPVIIVIVADLIFSKVIFTATGGDYSYLEEEYATKLSSVAGSWALICSLLIGIAFVVIANFKRFDDVLEVLKEGVSNSFLAVMNTASEVGYGNVIKSLAGFSLVAAVMLGISSNPLVSATIASSVLAGITGSASGGLSIALSTFAETFMENAAARGIDPQVLHRVAAVACGGLDTLPHNGAVITLLFATGMTHKESYLNIGMCTVIIPTISAIVIIILGSLGIC